MPSELATADTVPQPAEGLGVARDGPPSPAARAGCGASSARYAKKLHPNGSTYSGRVGNRFASPWTTVSSSSSVSPAESDRVAGVQVNESHSFKETVSSLETRLIVPEVACRVFFTDDPETLLILGDEESVLSPRELLEGHSQRLREHVYLYHPLHEIAQRFRPPAVDVFEQHLKGEPLTTVSPV